MITADNYCMLAALAESISTTAEELEITDFNI